MRGASVAGSTMGQIDTTLTSRPTKVAAATLHGQLGAHKLWIDSGGRDGRRANFAGFDLTGVDLAGRNLAAALFERAVLAGARLSGALLLAADLRDANLVRADLTAADLRGADLNGANLRDATMTGALVGEIPGTGKTTEMPS